MPFAAFDDALALAPHRSILRRIATVLRAPGPQPQHRSRRVLQERQRDILCAMRYANDAFAEILGLPMIWIPHSYPGCSQHAPNEHLLAPLAREACG
jgi:hypothetical protein